MPAQGSKQRRMISADIPANDGRLFSKGKAKTKNGGKLMLEFFRKAKRSAEKGFTLVELMIVVAIIGILAAVAIPQFASYRVKAYNTAAKSDIKNAKTELEAYYADNNNYPHE